MEEMMEKAQAPIVNLLLIILRKKKWPRLSQSNLSKRPSLHHLNLRKRSLLSRSRGKTRLHPQLELEDQWLKKLLDPQLRKVEFLTLLKELV
jgi:hypothetical protein